MKKIEFFASGIPKGQPRARACRRGAFAGVYDPGTADAWKFSVRAAALDCWDRQPFVGPVKVVLTLRFPRAKSHVGKDGKLKPSAPVRHTARPDADNAAKAILDALTTIGVWRDDSQVSSLVVRKVYDPFDLGGVGCVVTLQDDVE
jgi:Holliday junction resolvase RusA-like endonuclease